MLMVLMIILMMRIMVMMILNEDALGSQVAQSVEHATLEVEVQGSKPALGTW